MSKELPNNQKQNEEVDLVVFFNLIGKAIKVFLKFFLDLFKLVAKVLLDIIAHFYKRKFWYIGAVVIGGLVGLGIDTNTEQIYGANLFIETNFNTQRQVYENIKELHQLSLVDRDYEAIAQRLDISLEEAKSIKGFYIEPDIDLNTSLTQYVDYYKELDSTTKADFTYEKYMDGLNYYSFKQHKIGVAATNKYVFRKLKGGLINELNNNTYIQDLKVINQSNLQTNQRYLESQLNKMDSLYNTGLKLRLIEAEKDIPAYSGTVLNMGGTQQQSNQIDESRILSLKEKVQEKQLELQIEQVKTKNLVNVLANFTETGYDISKWTDKYVYTLPLFLISLTLLSFAVINLGRSVEQFKNKL